MIYLKMFTKSDFNKKSLIIPILSGLYPFLHFYDNNIPDTDTLFQFVFFSVICFLIPIVVYIVGLQFLQFKVFKVFEDAYALIFNLVSFTFLLNFLIFHFSKWYLLTLVFMALILGFYGFRLLTKVLVFQFILSVFSLINLIPKFYFLINNNNEWTNIDLKQNVAFKSHPNIFVIQPDGYANINELQSAIYNFDNTSFDQELEDFGFKPYKNYRSNYFSTISSNSSMMAMNHHYYSNTHKNSIRTYGANSVFTGAKNNVLKVFKANGYKTHYFSDNSYFVLDQPIAFDHCNIKRSDIKYNIPGGLSQISILDDLKLMLKKEKKNNSSQFVFIEKTVPGHIAYDKQSSRGIEVERVEYLKRLKFSNKWLKSLITEILDFDSDAMIVLVADHGGFVGLNYQLEIFEKKLNKEEYLSSFGSMLNIKWPSQFNIIDEDFKSSVNLFRQLFNNLSGVNKFDVIKDNASYLPYRTDDGIEYFKTELIDDKVIYTLVK